MLEIAGHALGGRAAAAVASIGTDEQRSLQIAQAMRLHRISDFLHGELQRAGALVELPNAARELLDRDHDWQCGHHRVLRAALGEMHAALHRARVDFVLLKGFPTAIQLYGRADSRPQDDIDLLVRRRDLDSAVRALDELGYRQQHRTKLARRMNEKLEYSTGLRSGARKVDLHWRLRYRPAYEIDYEQLWRTTTSYSLDGISYSLLSDEHALSFLLISIMDDIERGAAKLKYYIDLYMFLRRCHGELDWTGFLERRREENLLGVTTNALAVFFQLFHCEQEFPATYSALSACGADLAVADRGFAVGLMVARRRSLSNRLWFSRIYPAALPRYWLWLLYRSAHRHLGLLADTVAERRSS